MIGLIDTNFCNRNAYINILNYLELRHKIVNKPDQISSDVTTLLIPGVSSFEGIASSFHDNNFNELIHEKHREGLKIIGTCAGMQLLFDKSEESPNITGLSIVKGEVKKFKAASNITLNVGWKKTTKSEFYFVHSYYCISNQKLDEVEYSEFNGTEFLASFRHGNVYGMQFHPEKSGKFGLTRLEGILRQ